jgi:hypothetical protein
MRSRVLILLCFGISGCHACSGKAKLSACTGNDCSALCCDTCMPEKNGRRLCGNCEQLLTCQGCSRGLKNTWKCEDCQRPHCIECLDKEDMERCPRCFEVIQENKRKAEQQRAADAANAGQEAGNKAAVQPTTDTTAANDTTADEASANKAAANKASEAAMKKTKASAGKVSDGKASVGKVAVETIPRKVFI